MCTKQLGTSKKNLGPEGFDLQLLYEQNSNKKLKKHIISIIKEVDLIVLSPIFCCILFTS